VTKNLLECDPDELEQRLIAYGRRDRAPDEARRRTIANVTIAAAAGAGLTATSVSSVAGAAPWLLVTKWAFVGVAAGAVTLGVADRVEQRAASRKMAEPIARSATAITPPSRPAAQASAEVSSSTDAPAAIEKHEDEIVGEAVRERAPRVSARSPESKGEAREVFPPAMAGPLPASPTSEESSLQLEVRLLEEARHALDARAPARASAALDRFEAEFPAGRMQIEARALRVETLFALGQRDEARALARSFLASHPRSPAAMRVTRLLESMNSGTAMP
jgi:hypothetical protein